MKKLVLLAAFIFAASFSAANAQTVNKKVEKTEKAASVQKEKATKVQVTVKDMACSFNKSTAPLTRSLRWNKDV